MIYYTPEKDYLRLFALAIFSLAIVTDGVDGYVARIQSQKSRLGVILDPLADKLLLVSAFVVLATLRALPEPFQIPPWLAILVVSRDLFILGGSAIIYLLTQKLDVKPRFTGKLATFFQMAMILVALSGFPQRALFYGLTTLFTLLSGLGYLRDGARQLNRSAPFS